MKLSVAFSVVLLGIVMHEGVSSALPVHQASSFSETTSTDSDSDAKASISSSSITVSGSSDGDKDDGDKDDVDKDDGATVSDEAEMKPDDALGADDIPEASDDKDMEDLAIEDEEEDDAEPSEEPDMDSKFAPTVPPRGCGANMGQAKCVKPDTYYSACWNTCQYWISNDINALKDDTWKIVDDGTPCGPSLGTVNCPSPSYYDSCKATCNYWRFIQAI